jgi:hypothetical protein
LPRYLGEMLQPVLLALICVGLTAIAALQRAHQKWVQRELHKKQMAHERLTDKVRKLSLSQEPIPLVRPAQSWDDDHYETRKLDGRETFLPVDFQHKLW